MLTSPGEVLTAAYFKKHRSLAMGIVKSGASIGSVSYPPLLTYLVSEYGLRGALLLTGAVSLHSLPAALLLRPTSYFRKRAKNGHVRAVESAEEHETADDSTYAVTSVDNQSVHSCQRDLERFEEETEASSAAFATTGYKVHEDCISETELKSATKMHVIGSSVVTGSDSKAKFKSEIARDCHCEEARQSTERQPLTDRTTDGPYLWNPQYSEVVTENPIMQGIDRTDDQNHTLKRYRPVLRWLKSKLLILDFSLFRRPSFRLFFVYFMLSPTVNVGVDYLPALADQRDVPKLQAAQLLSIIGGLDMASRLFSGFLADLKVVPVPAMVASALVVLGVAYQCVRFLTSFALLLVLAVVQGLLAGVVNAMVPVLILHVVGLRDMAKGIGFQFLAEGSFLAAFHPLLGK